MFANSGWVSKGLLPLWGMELGVSSGPIKNAFECFSLTLEDRFTLIIIALEINIWIPAKPCCEQRRCDEIKLDARLVYMSFFPYWLPHL